MKAARYIAHKLLGDYALYRIFRLDLGEPIPERPSTHRMSRLNPASDFVSATDPAMKGFENGVSGPEAYGFGAWDGDTLIAACCFWHGERYKTRNFWPLKSGEAKLIQITTAASHRGKGIAPSLINFAAQEMKSLGFTTLYARVWRSHSSSIKAFTKAGWKYAAFAVEVYPFGLRKPWRYVRKLL